MARIRSIKPEFWTSEQILECSPTTRLLFIGLWNFCDDGGNHVDSVRTVKAQIFPADDVSTLDVRRMLDELSSNGLIAYYEAQNKRFLHVTGWKTHQKIDRPTFKHPPFQPTTSTGARRAIDEPSPPEGGGGDRSGEEGSGAVGEPTPRKRAPSKHAMPADFGISDKVREWAAEKGHDRLELHLESFRAKATAKGYTYADWDAAFMGAIRENWAKLPAENGVDLGARAGGGRREL